MLSSQQIAKVCHETNRAYCQVLGDNSQTPWSEAPDWQRESAIAGVQTYIGGPTTITPQRVHEHWVADKEKDGWVYGAVKDPEKKEHPCMVPYSELPPEQKVKDSLFLAVIKALSNA